MITQELLAYVRQQVQQGISDETIKSTLLTSGWTEIDVHQALNLIPPQTSPVAQLPLAQPAKTVPIAVIVTVILLLGTGLAYAAIKLTASPPAPAITTENISVSSLPMASSTQDAVGTTSAPTIEIPVQSSQTKKTQPISTPTSQVPSSQPSSQITTSVSLQIDSCRTISAAGEYSLSGDLTNIKSEPCIKIQNVNNVSLNCQNHTITSKDENYNIYVKGSSNFKINNCKLTSSVLLPSESTQHVLRIEDSKQGEISNSTVGGNYATISGSSFVTGRNNTFNTQFIVYKSNNVTLKDNSFNFAGGAVTIAFYEGSSNSLISNVLDGKSDGIFENKNGTDDVVFLDNENDDLIQGNTLRNAYECAIEFNRVAGVKIIGNKVNNTGLSFLCGWHYVSAQGTTVRDNVVNNSPSLFWFFRERALRSNEQYVYFQNNVFENNKLINPKTGTGFSFAAMIDFNRLIVPSQNYIIGNNILRNNDFTKLVGSLRLAPGNIVTDGGGNICSGAEEEAKGGGSSVSFNCN